MAAGDGMVEHTWVATQNLPVAHKQQIDYKEHQKVAVAIGHKPAASHKRHRRVPVRMLAAGHNHYDAVDILHLERRAAG